jgi:phosphoribosylformimino-5-aminoimidazole carboxamide ribonucleotide (ProFAR) isomerase
VVLGTAAINDLEFLDDALAAWGVRVVVAVDVRGGHVSVSGWTQSTQMVPEDLITRLQRQGVAQIAYTSADRDGMLQGPDLEEVKRVGAAVRGRFLYSGGISSLDDLRALKDLRLLNLAGVISGKALYERRFTIEEAHEVLGDD